MHSITSYLAVTLTLATKVFSEELKPADVPPACVTICGPIVTLTSTCDINPESEAAHSARRLRSRDDEASDGESDEAIESPCICKNTSFDVSSIAALCAACLTQNAAETDGEFNNRHPNAT